MGGEAGGEGGCWCGWWTSTGVSCARAACGDEGREVPGLLCQLPVRVVLAAGGGLEDATEAEAGLKGATTQASCCSTDVSWWWCGLGAVWGLCGALRGARGGAAAGAELAVAVWSRALSNSLEAVWWLGFRSRASC